MDCTSQAVSVVEMFPFKGQVVGLRSRGGGSLTWGEVEAVLRGAQNTLRSVRSLVRKGLQGSNGTARVLQEGAPKHPHRHPQAVG